MVTANAARVLIVGFGSIGRRHASNLRALGIADLIVYDNDPACRAVAQKMGARDYGALSDALDAEPLIVFVCTPPVYHLEVAVAAAERGCHLFIEKPLSHSGDGLDDLIALARRRRLVTMVGCNMRFHHGPVSMKRLLDEGAVGRITAAILDAGHYMPDWHPEQDYRRRYSARRSQGGGVVLDGIHEIDYIRWLCGEVTEVSAYGGRLSSLDIDVEDTVNVLLKFVPGYSAMIHLDYVQRAYARNCKIVGEEGTIVWDIYEGVKLYIARSGAWTVFPTPDGYQINDMYLDELRHLLDCLGRGGQTMCDIEEGARVTRIALAVKHSMQRGERVVL